MGKDNEDSKERKNRKTAFERINKKSRSNKDHLNQSNGERANDTKPSDSGVRKVTW